MSVQAHSKEVTISRATLAQGCGWSVSDVTFRATSARSRFESRHEGIAVVAVTAGSFRYRASHGCVTLMPGALMLATGFESTLNSISNIDRELRHDNRSRTIG